MFQQPLGDSLFVAVVFGMGFPLDGNPCHGRPAANLPDFIDDWHIK